MIARKKGPEMRPPLLGDLVLAVVVVLLVYAGLYITQGC